MLFDPVEANHFSPMRIDLYCFPSKLERQPSKCQNFEAQSHSLFSRCLRLATTITDSHPRLATGGWLGLTRQAFHLLVYDGDQHRYAQIAGHGFRILAEAMEKDLPYEIKCHSLLYLMHEPA